MKKIRVLMCGSNRKEKGGMNSVIDQLMDHEWDNNIELSYLATHISGNNLKKIVYFIFAYIKLFFLILFDKFDIIHIHMSYKGSFVRKYYVAKLCKKHNKKVIIHLHGSEFKDYYFSGSDKLKNKIVELFNFVDITIALGKEWKDFILSIAPNANVEVVNNAVAMPNLEEKQVQTKRVFLFMGALIKRKGVMDFLQAVKSLVDEGVTDMQILIAGSGEEENTLKDYVLNNSLEKYITFLGWIGKDEREKLFKQSDVLVLPSYNEGLPMAILEAMSYGLSIISTNVGSIDEAVKDNENGYLITPGDIVAIASKIRILTENARVWQKQSFLSRKIAENNFSDEKFFFKVQNIYFSL